MADANAHDLVSRMALLSTVGTSAPLRIHVELIGHVIDLVGGANDLNTLKNFSVVHSSLKDLCQKYLFRSIVLRNCIVNVTGQRARAVKKPTIEAFARLLRSQPSERLANYVERFSIHLYSDFEDSGEDTAYVLGKLNNIESFNLECFPVTVEERRRFAWNNIPAASHQELTLFLLRNPLRSVMFQGVLNIPLDLLGMAEIPKKLQLIGSTVAPPILKKNQGERIRLEHLFIVNIIAPETMASHVANAVDFSRLSALHLISGPNGPAIHRYLQHANHLEHLTLEIYGLKKESLSGVIFPPTNVLKPSVSKHFASLKSICITIVTDKVKATIPFFDFETEMAQLSGCRNLEKIIFNIQYDEYENMARPTPQSWETFSKAFANSKESESLTALKNFSLRVAVVPRDGWDSSELWVAADLQKMLDGSRGTSGRGSVTRVRTVRSPSSKVYWNIVDF